MAKKETPAKTPEAPVKPEPAKEPSEKEKLGRNSLCPCGSGKKYKYCCGRGRS